MKETRLEGSDENGDTSLEPGPRRYIPHIAPKPSTSSSIAVPTLAEHPATRRRAAVEFLTSAVYVSVSILAVLMVFEGSDAHGRARNVALTAVALTLAHVFATVIATQVVYEGKVESSERSILAGQVLGGLTVGVFATIPLLIDEGSAGVVTSELLLLGIIAGTGFYAIRSGGVGAFRAGVASVLTVLVAIAVLVLKRLAGH